MDRITMDGRAISRAPDGSRVVKFRASTPAVDRHGTIIKPEGINTLKYDQNPVFLWAHDGYGGMFGGPSVDSVIGRVTGHRKSKEAFDIDVEFAPPEASQAADQAFRLVQAGFLSAVSIGFVPVKQSEQEIEGRGMVPVFDEVELLEVSLVPIPSNPEAVKIVRAMAFASDAVEEKPNAPSLKDAMDLHRADEEWRLAVKMFGADPTWEQLRTAGTYLRYGKVLSTINEQRIRNAHQNLQDCLDTLKKVAEEEAKQEDPTPPAHKAADAGAVTAAIKAAFDNATKADRVKDVIARAFKKGTAK